MQPPDPSLDALARAYGVETRYTDGLGRERQASTETLLHVLRALGAEIWSPEQAPQALARLRRLRGKRVLEPTMVVPANVPLQIRLRLPEKARADRLDWELRHESLGQASGCWQPEDRLCPGEQEIDGERILEVDAPLPPLKASGATLTVRGADFVAQAHLLITPGRCPAPEITGSYGLFLPLYAARSRRNGGCGDLGDLERLAIWTARRGGRLFGTLPLLAGFLDEPFDPSPYATVSRLFWNELYLDLERIPELRHSAEAREILYEPRYRDRLRRLREDEQVDYRRAMAAKREVLEALARTFFAEVNDRHEGFNRFAAQHGSRLWDYARFRAACERERAGWPGWQQLRADRALTDVDVDPERARYHAYVQWCLAEQLLQVSHNAAQAGAEIYLDLPVGVHGGGYDVWSRRSCFARRVSAGAPPDAYFPSGQNWGFPPLHPQGIRREGYGYLRESVSTSMGYADVLRIDHVMGLHRMFWIPEGASADDGVYVHYRPDEGYAALAIEAQRTSCTVVGEDLGTVPEGVREKMKDYGMLRMSILPFETEREIDPSAGGDGGLLRDHGEDVLVSLNTHDMPTFAGLWHGRDLDTRRELGQIDADEATRLHDERARFIAALQARLGTEGTEQTLRACLERLAASDLGVLLVNLEDLWLETRPHNVPGTSTELPNWKRKTDRSLAAIIGDPAIAELLERIRALREHGDNGESEAPR